jgi:hypothetical protein
MTEIVRRVVASRRMPVGFSYWITTSPQSDQDRSTAIIPHGASLPYTGPITETKP